MNHGGELIKVQLQLLAGQGDREGGTGSRRHGGSFGGVALKIDHYGRSFILFVVV